MIPSVAKHFPRMAGCFAEAWIQFNERVFTEPSIQISGYTNENAESALERAFEYYEQREYDQALEAVNEGLQTQVVRDPHLRADLFRIKAAIIHFEKKEYDQALEIVDEENAEL